METLEKIEGNILKVSSKSSPVSIAGALAKVMETNEVGELHAIGAGAVNQAVKAVAIARGYVAPTGYNLYCVPGFDTVTIDDSERSSIIIYVKKSI